MGLVAASVQAEIVVSWESNGVLVAEGMLPGTTGIVESASKLGEVFTNAAAFFDAEYVADSNGTIRLAIPMFFQVKGAPKIAINDDMVLVPAGTNSGTDPDYGVYSLTVDAFYMNATEVTKAQWDMVYTWATNNSYSFSNIGFGKGSDHPVYNVNWHDCVKWCNARSQMEGKMPCYTVGGSVYKTGENTPDIDLDAGGYRLPTSDEWEYAARGGLNSKRFPWGDTITHSEANYYSHDMYSSYDISTTRNYHPDYDDANPYTSPAGDFAPNAYGLYDMAGNLAEWCTDWHPNYVGSDRVLRGGSWNSMAYSARCGYVNRKVPDSPHVYSCGFRAVLPAN